MDRDTFIIPVYWLVDDEFKKGSAVHRVRHAGFAPERSDVEVITMAICGEYCTRPPDKDRFDDVMQHDRHCLPTRSERSGFVRQAAHLWPCKAAWPRRFTLRSGQAPDPGPPLDTLPLPVCPYTRARRARGFAGQADDGDCDAKALHYYGVTRGVRLSRCGMIRPSPLLEARPHDLNPLEGLLAGLRGSAPADPGCIDLPLQQHLAQQQSVSVVPPRKKNRQTSLSPAPLVQTCARGRQRVETVGSHLPERFGVDRRRGHDVWHDQHRLMRKVLAHTVAVFLNLQLGRQPLDLDGLVAS